MTESKPTARARIAPAGLMFLAITSIGWGFNWPVTKYLLSELPPLTMRGSTGVVGAGLLCRQVSVSPQGFPSEKNCFARANFSFVPLFTGQLFILPEGLLWRDSGEVTRSGLPCPAGDGLGR